METIYTFSYPEEDVELDVFTHGDEEDARLRFIEDLEDIINAKVNPDDINFIKAREVPSQDDLDDKYGPEIEAPDENALWETYSPYVEQVKKRMETHPNTVWTVVDGDDGIAWIVPGYHFVNRIGYIFMTKPYDEKALDEEEYVWG
jgi:hypothetical protein